MREIEAAERCATGNPEKWLKTPKSMNLKEKAVIVPDPLNDPLRSSETFPRSARNGPPENRG
jgi:hypothetical protein